MTAIRLDETHCPAGLEKAMYELAFKFRSDRHDLERALNEALKQIELRKEEVIEAQKKMKYHEDIYKQENETLLEFRVRTILYIYNFNKTLGLKIDIKLL